MHDSDTCGAGYTDTWSHRTHTYIHTSHWTLDTWSHWTQLDYQKQISCQGTLAPHLPTLPLAHLGDLGQHGLLIHDLAHVDLSALADGIQGEHTAAKAGMTKGYHKNELRRKSKDTTMNELQVKIQHHC